MEQRDRHIRGFTLPELLAVLAILLLAIAGVVLLWQAAVHRSAQVVCVRNRAELAQDYIFLRPLHEADNVAAMKEAMEARGGTDISFAEGRDGSVAVSGRGLCLLDTEAAVTLLLSPDGEVLSSVCAAHPEHTEPDGMINVGTPPTVPLLRALEDCGEPVSPAVDSTAPELYADGALTPSGAVKAALTAAGVDLLAEQNVRGWALRTGENGNAVWVTDLDLAACDAGVYVRALRCDPEAGRYEAGYVRLQAADTAEDGENADYSVMADADGQAVWKPQTAALPDYASVLAIYNALPKTYHTDH